MNNMKSFVVVCIFLSVFASCDKAKEEVSKVCKDANTCFKVDSLSAQLKKRLDGNCIGYGYIICAKDQVVAVNSGGFERLDQDAPKKAFSVFDRMNPASLSKTITGIALLHALNKKGIPTSEFMYKYLPPSWTLGPEIKTITFSDLLKHTSGIRFTGEMDYPGFKTYIAAGVTAENKNGQVYDNANFAIMRILIPIIDGQNIPGTDIERSTKYGQAFVQYANDNIFSKLGIPYVECKPETENQNLCYQFPADGGKGGDFGDFTTTSGGAGFNISVAQYAQVIRAAFYTADILPSGMGQTMRDSVWGFDFWLVGRTSFFDVAYQEKNGFFPGNQNPGEFNGVLCMFDNNVSIVLYVNSQLIYPGGVNQVVLDAFDASRL